MGKKSDSKEDDIMDIILKHAYEVIGYFYLTPNIIENHENDFTISDCDRFALMMSDMGLCEYLSRDNKPILKITKEGIEAIQIYDSYSQYVKRKKEDQIISDQIRRLTRSNIRLRNLNIIVGLGSFILGLLLSTPIKNILKLWIANN